MQTVFDCDSVTLHVRETNRAAFSLYHEVLGYEIKDKEHSYYADHEDAYKMRLTFKKKQQEESKAEEEVPEGKGDVDTYAESNPTADSS